MGKNAFGVHEVKVFQIGREGLVVSGKMDMDNARESIKGGPRRLRKAFRGLPDKEKASTL